MSQTLLTTRQLAERWGVGNWQIVRLVRAGRLPAVDMSTGKGERAKWMINVVDIEKFERTPTNIAKEDGNAKSDQGKTKV